MEYQSHTYTHGRNTCAHTHSQTMGTCAHSRTHELGFAIFVVPDTLSACYATVLTVILIKLLEIISVLISNVGHGGVILHSRGVIQSVRLKIIVG